jgi:hypothetical protein
MSGTGVSRDLCVRPLTGDDGVIRYERAAEIAVLAEEDEAAYPGKNRFHVNISQFEVTVDRITELLTSIRKSSQTFTE